MYVCLGVSVIDGFSHGGTATSDPEALQSRGIKRRRSRTATGTAGVRRNRTLDDEVTTPSSTLEFEIEALRR